MGGKWLCGIGGCDGRKMGLASVNLVLVMVAMVIAGSGRSHGGDGGICNDNNYPTLPSFLDFLV